VHEIQDPRGRHNPPTRLGEGVTGHAADGQIGDHQRHPSGIAGAYPERFVDVGGGEPVVVVQREDLGDQISHTRLGFGTTTVGDGADGRAALRACASASGPARS
jgi:hypothetical protein